MAADRMTPNATQSPQADSPDLGLTRMQQAGQGDLECAGEYGGSAGGDEDDTLILDSGNGTPNGGWGNDLFLLQGTSDLQNDAQCGSVGGNGWENDTLDLSGVTGSDWTVLLDCGTQDTGRSGSQTLSIDPDDTDMLHIEDIPPLKW